MMIAVDELSIHHRWTIHSLFGGNWQHATYSANKNGYGIHNHLSDDWRFKLDRYESNGRVEGQYEKAC